VTEGYGIVMPFVSCGTIEPVTDRYGGEHGETGRGRWSC